VATVPLTHRAAAGPGSGAAPAVVGPRHRINLMPLLYLSPSLALFGAFIVYPFVRAIWFSFNKTSLLGGIIEFTGFDNFSAIFANPHFLSALGNSAVWTFGAVGLQLVFGVLGAFLLNQKFKLRGAARGLAMIPWATPSVLVALIWLWMLDPNRGIINGVLTQTGLIDSPIAFLSRSDTAMPTLIVVDAWQGIPFFAVMILAALQSVPHELKDSARTDGCGPVGVFRNVVLPHILPTILITLVLRLIWTANYIDLAYVLTGGGPARATTTLPLLSYLTAYKGGDFGQGAAYAMVQAAILSIFVVLYIRLTRERKV
jgi:multiple sugar transport system permease protein